MRAASAVFPFRSTLRHLQLQKRWWHRLCVVTFFGVLLCSSIFVAAIVYDALAPQVSAMPQIVSEGGGGDIFDRIAAEQQQGQASVPPPPTGFHPDVSDGSSTKQPPHPSKGASGTSAVVTPGGRCVDSRAFASLSAKAIQPMIDSHGVVQQVPVEDVLESLEAGERRVVIMCDPDGTKRWILEDDMPAALKAGGQIAASAPINDPSMVPAYKTIQMPNGSVAQYSGKVDDDVVRSQWNRAKNRQTFRAVALAISISIAVALFVSYLLQTAYRAVLYVIYGALTPAGS